MNRKPHFRSLVESDLGSVGPHVLYSGLAIDAAMLAVNEDLPALSDDEHQRLLTAMHTAAVTVLRLTRVPDDWLSFVEAMNVDPKVELREEIKDTIYDALPPTPALFTERQQAAMRAVRECIAPAKWPRLEAAIADLDLAWACESIDAVEAAFALGWKLGRNPTPLLFHKTALDALKPEGAE